MLRSRMEVETVGNISHTKWMEGCVGCVAVDYEWADDDYVDVVDDDGGINSMREKYQPEYHTDWCNELFVACMMMYTVQIKIG